ncbi:winged helix-turn-helix transcriptional regulator [Natrialba swarupiae]|uniref:Winged helix-turn-helix transcriptional regulator n=1 Tax=Natrialba swarupiae TaxID=2448032 RepID=A0A5D5AMI8_9EURY|nr:winged helix-turn-helix transcriptional regulator [Natrialba swarupiae]TYT62135.1 winged helix-turn-helix transcriptional regulator [Natrialba swarupiae]
MSDSTTPPRRRRDQQADSPRAVVHKQILDTAKARPNASMKEIADDVSAATTSIVERVLEEYGDPAETEDETDGGSTDLGDETDANSTESGGEDSSDAGQSGSEDGSDATENVTEDGSGETADSDAEPTGSVVGVDEPTAIESDNRGPDETEVGTRSTIEADRNHRDADEPDRDDHTETAADPASSDRSPTSDRDRSTRTQIGTSLEPSDVTEKQLETLREIARFPEATQAELADNLGVTSATISQRVNGIDGFDWSNRQQFVADLLGNGPDRVDGTSEGGASNADRKPVLADGSARQSTPEREDGEDGDAATDDDLERALADSVEELSEQVTHLSRRIEALEERFPPEHRTNRRPELPSDPELVHKILYACLSDEHITEKEELRVLKAVVGGDSEPT